MKPGDVRFSSQSRILVVGTSGAGKGTMARRLAGFYGLRDVGLGGPGGLVVHGNYSKVRDLTWGACETVVWLDYPRWLVMYRVFRRTVSRWLRGTVLWSGNRETFRKSFLSRDSILVWAWTTYRLRRRQYLTLFLENPYRIEHLIRVCRPLDVGNLFNAGEPYG